MALLTMAPYLPWPSSPLLFTYRQAAKGSKVGDALFHSFELPDDSGTVLVLTMSTALPPPYTPRVYLR